MWRAGVHVSRAVLSGDQSLTIEVPAGAKLRKYLGFNRKDRDTQLEVVAEDLWAEDRLKALAAEIELWCFLDRNEASEIS